MTESEIRDKIYEFLKKKGIMCWKDKQMIKQGGRGFPKFQKGLPDLMGILSDGTFLGIEVKKPGGKVSPEQIEFINQANEKGAMCFIAYDLEDVRKRFI